MLGQIKVSSSVPLKRVQLLKAAAINVLKYCGLFLLQIKLIQLPAVPPNSDFSSPTAQQELLLAREWHDAAANSTDAILRNPVCLVCWLKMTRHSMVQAWIQQASRGSH